MATYQDGAFPCGAPTLTINNVSYVCASFNGPQKTSVVANITDGTGAHVGANSVKGPTTGTAELQLATSATVLPNTAAENAVAGVFTHDGTTYFITSVGKAMPAGPQIWTSSIQFQAKVSA